MATVILGRTKCGICGLILDRSEDVTAFPPFVTNERDPMRLFHDNAFHTQCVTQHPLARRVEHTLANLRDHGRPERQLCIVCSQRLTGPESDLFLGYLADSGSLSSFNYACVHSRCVALWPERESVLDALRQARASKEMTGIGIDWLISRLSPPLA